MSRFDNSRFEQSRGQQQTQQQAQQIAQQASAYEGAGLAEKTPDKPVTQAQSRQPEEEAPKPASKLNEKAVKELAASQNISQAAARATADRYRANPGSAEFRTLGPAAIQALNKAANLSATTNLVEINRQRGGKEYITQAEADRVRKSTPRQYDILTRRGSKEYEAAATQAIETYVKKSKADEARAAARAKPQIQKPETMPARFANWTAQELRGGKVENGKLIPSPYGVKGTKYIPYPAWAEEKIAAAQNDAVEALKPYLKPGVTNKDVFDMIRQSKPKKDIVKTAAQVGREVIDVPAAVQSGKYNELREMGVSWKDINAAALEVVRVKAIKGEKITGGERDIARAEMVQEFQKRQANLNKATAGLAADMTLEMLPVIGTYRVVKRALADKKITLGEAGMIAFYVGLDLAFISGVLSEASIAARGAIGLSRAARLSAAGRAVAVRTLAEIKAPITILRHPLETIKTPVKLVETLVRPSKIPLAATEAASATVRLPVKAFASAEEAMKVRDVATLAAIKEGKFTTKVGGKEVELSTAFLQTVGDPVAVHATPDIRPFLEGATIQAGREGGMFVAPNLHSNFTMASAFGDMPEGGVRGALIIRDAELLSKLGGSGKIYRNTAEVEALLKAGVELPKPNQVLITRAAKADVTGMLKEAKELRAVGKIDDAAALEAKAKALQKAGDKLTLLVYGKPYTAKEIAKLKVFGAADNIRQIFNPPAKIKGVDLAKAYDELNDTRRQANVLVKEAAKLRKLGQIDEAADIERQANELIERASRLARGLETSATAGGVMRLAFTSSRRTPISTLNMLGGNRLELNRRQYERLGAALGSRQLYQELRRIGERLVFDSRGRITGIRDARGMISRPERVSLDTRLEPRGMRTEARVETPGSRRATAGTTRTETPRATATSRGETPARAEGTPDRTTGERTTRDTTTRTTIRGTTRTTTGKSIPRTPPPGKGKRKGEDWTQEDIKSAVAWPMGAVIHAIRAPYRRGIDEKTFNRHNLPPDLKIIDKYEGPGSTNRGATVLRGKPPKRKTVDVGLDDVIISRTGRNRVSIRHQYGTGTTSNLTVQRRPAKKKKRRFSRIIHG